jgi:hypothetical protein
MVRKGLLALDPRIKTIADTLMDAGTIPESCRFEYPCLALDICRSLVTMRFAPGYISQSVQSTPSFLVPRAKLPCGDPGRQAIFDALPQIDLEKCRNLDPTIFLDASNCLTFSAMPGACALHWTLFRMGRLGPDAGDRLTLAAAGTGRQTTGNTCDRIELAQAVCCMVLSLSASVSSYHSVRHRGSLS